MSKIDHLIYTPMLSIAPTYATSYTNIDSFDLSPKINNRYNISECDNSDTFSNLSRKKLKNYIDWFVEQSKVKVCKNMFTHKSIYYKLNCITLTLCYEQFYTDQTIKQKLLNQFFVEARTKWNLCNYIWRAEKQKNGNIHFHIVTDIFVPWQECREIWNRIQDKLDLVKLYSAKQKAKYELGFTYTKEDLKEWSLSVLKARWREGKKTGWSNPNSVDIHSLKTVKNIAAYMAKYLAKNEELDLKQFEYAPSSGIQVIAEQEKLKAEYLSKHSVQGRNWFVSDRIRKYCKNIKMKITEKISTLVQEEFNTINNIIVENMFFTVIKKGCSYFIKKSSDIKKAYYYHITKIRLMLNPPNNYNCYEMIKKHVFSAPLVKTYSETIIQLSLF